MKLLIVNIVKYCLILNYFFTIIQPILSVEVLLQKVDEFIYNNKNSTVTAEGKLGIGSGLQYIKLLTAGRAKTTFLKPPVVKNDSTVAKSAPLTLEVMAGIDMMVPEKLLKIMLNDIQAGSFNDSDIDYNRDDFAEHALTEFISDKEDYAKVLEQAKTTN